MDDCFIMLSIRYNLVYDKNQFLSEYKYLPNKNAITVVATPLPPQIQ